MCGLIELLRELQSKVIKTDNFVGKVLSSSSQKPKRQAAGRSLAVSNTLSLKNWMKHPPSEFDLSPQQCHST